MTTVRRATSDDLATVLELAAAFSETEGHDFDPARARAGIEPMLDDDRLGMIWLIDDGDGYAALTWGWSIESGGPEAVLDELFVRTQGRGAGTHALEVVEQACRDRGVRRIFLETELVNEGARRLYLRHGFVAEESIWMSKELT